MIAAVVIAGILIGLGAVYVSLSSQKEDRIVYDLTKEISYEASRVIDKGVLVSSTSEEINQNITALANYYSSSYPGIDFTIVYGSLDSAYIIRSYEDIEGSVGTSTGGAPATIIIKGQVFEGSQISGEDVIEVKINDESEPITFVLTEGQNFFIVIKKENAGDVIVDTGS